MINVIDYENNIIAVIERKATNGMVSYKGGRYKLLVSDNAYSAHIRVNTSKTKRIYGHGDITVSHGQAGLLSVGVVHRLKWVTKHYSMCTVEKAKQKFLQHINFEYEFNK